MRSNTTASNLAPLVLGVLLGAGVLGGCDGPTGGYAPPPPAGQPPADVMAKAATPRFQPLIRALIAQRKAARGDLSMVSNGTGSQGAPVSSFEASRAAADALIAAIRAAQLTPEEARTWNVVSSLEDATLEKLLK